MSSVKAVIKELSLDLTDIPANKKNAAKTEVREYIENEILRSVQAGISPVKGEGRFRTLDKDYAKKEKGGVRTANLQLEGDMLDDLKSKNIKGDAIEIGIRGKNAPKADGHNQISGEAKAWASKTKRTKYKRRFIPADNQKFADKIVRGYNSILDEYRFAAPDDIEVDIDSVVETPDSSTVTVGSLFSDDAIEALLAQALARRDAN